jgi:acylphosphatase
VVVVLLLVAGLGAADEPRKDTPGQAVARMVYYSGHVQGVGFRATAVEIARGHPVTGWVKNLADGRVQLFVEGSEKPVEQFLTAIRRRWQKNIEKEQVEERKPTGEHRSFVVKR